ncbi:hypothetical protein Poli38472_008506 [Pythium oligandrum]|uniref:DNA mismatch repair proteins mutS family domain-containing protein n=1 Tax=Pythium oligandrum TaxID=41045 RepID=A0A8K1FEG9_PYTOL|nr:hypothetical protein Poli38472_008506 [Pythium oligandrum]|eukprot:TMW55858.1 hypothetical protein Poli38472_008506 [Pythium oligandrum]
MSDVEDAPLAEIALQIKNTKHLKQVGVAVRRPRPRRSCVKGSADEDTKQWELVLYAFSDSSELTNLETLLVQLAPSKCFLSAELSQDPHVGDSKKVHALLQTLDVANVYIKKHAFKDTGLEGNLTKLLGVSSLASYKNELDMQLAVGSLACLIDSLELMSDADGFGCYALAGGSLSSAMQLDSAAIWSLNLLPDPSVKSSSRFGGSVLEILNRGKTPMGRRLLERWIRQPLLNLKDIEQRQEVVQIFVDDSSLRMELLDECMKALPDLERLSVVLERKTKATITNLVSVYDAAVDAMPRILKLLQNYEGANAQILKNKYIDGLDKVLNDLSGYKDLIQEVVDLDSRPTLVVNAKHDEELQNLRNEWNDLLSDIEDEHRNAIQTISDDVKCEKDKVRGFVFRIINKKEEARISKIPYVHICQVLVNGVHFTTTKLKSLANEYKRVRSEYEKRQAHLLTAAVDVASTYVPVLEAATTIFADLDVLLGFAHAACHAGSGYCRPTVEENGECVALTGSRHPCVELQDDVSFIPNDYEFHRDKSRFQLITGPNMGGKSTYIRQLGTIAVMAQIGSFVPADVARLPIFDKLLVRVGAGDLQQRGVSTFMMEMLEAGAILHKATDRSLVIIDELGRGTSTYDGFGLAWAISEYLLTKVRAMCLFATHFHELTALEQEHPQGFVNKHVTAMTSEREITMIYQVRDGACMESFGVHVAAMAGFPEPVLRSAKRKAHELEAVERGISMTLPAAKKPSLEKVRKFAALSLDHLGTNETSVLNQRPTTLSKKRHRFQKVGERVANLQTELQLHVKTNANELSLTFQEELGLQGELSMLESFQVLYRKLQPLVTTTPQLLHHLPKIVKLLKAELTAEPIAEIQRDRMVPVMKLITALARELRKEFYPHFAGVLPLLVAIIDTKDPELSTQVFKTLTMLFNFLRVQLLKDMDAVHRCYFPLLGHPKPFVRDFAAQTLSVLLRRIDDSKDLRKYLSTYLRALSRGSGRENEILRDGSARLFFDLLKNVNHSFHSRMKEVFVALLGAFRPKSSSMETDADDQDQERELIYDIVSRTSLLMVRYTDATNAKEMLDCFSHVLKKMLTKGERHAANDLYIERVLTILLSLVKFKSGKLITQNSQNVEDLHKLCDTLLSQSWILSETTEGLRDAMLRLFEVVWRLFPAEDDVLAKQTQQFFSCAEGSDNDSVALYWCVELLALIDRQLLHSHVTVDFVRSYVFPNAMRLAFETLLAADVAAFAVLICRLGVYAAAHDDVADENQLVLYRHGYRLFTYPAKDCGKVILAKARELVNDALTASSEDVVVLAWKMVRAVALLDVEETQRLSFAQPLLRSVEERLTEGDVAKRALRAELWRVQQIALQQQESSEKKGKKAKKTAEPFVWQALRGNEKSYAMLSTFHEFLQMQTLEKQRELLSSDLLEEAERVFADNLRSPLRPLRLVTLEILARFTRLSFHDSDEENAVLVGECDLLDHSLQAERLCEHVSVEVEREIVRQVNRVQILCRAKQTPEIYKKLAVHHLFGLYHVKFSTLWSHVADAIAAIAQVEFQSIVWPSLQSEIWFAAFRAELPSATAAADASSDGASGEKTLADLEKDIRAATKQEFLHVCRLERGELDASLVTDTLTHHSLLWKGIEKFVEPFETKTKFFVPVFLLYVRDQYTAIYSDEVDDDKLRGLQEALDKVQTLEVGTWIQERYAKLEQLTTKAVRQRLLDYLRLFATFKNLKGAYAQTFLHDFCFDLLMKSDEGISKLALQCMYGFGKKHLAAYKEQLNRIADSTTFREELTTFHIAESAGIVLQEHRSALLPILMRLLYSKAVSKKGRNAGDTVGARRAAILSYLAALKPNELVYFVELIVRAFSLSLRECVDDNEAGEQRVTAVTSVEVVGVQSSRILGFLNILEDLISQLGVHLAAFVPSLANVVLAVLESNYREREEELAAKKEAEEDNEDVEMDEDQADDETEAATTDGKTLAMRKQIRTLAYRRLAEMLDKFDERVDLRPWVAGVLSVSHQAILHLPNAVIGAQKSSALLEFVVSVASADRARQQLTEEHVLSLISCLSSGLTGDVAGTVQRGVSPEILGSLLQFLSAMLDGDEKHLSAMDVDENDQKQSAWQLLPHIPRILAAFVTRFQSKAARYAQERYAGSSKRELVFLCRVSQHLEATDALQQSAQQSALDLFQLLLPFLQRNHRSSAADMENILQVLAQLVPLLTDPKRHAPALAKLLAPGPNALTDRVVRDKLVSVFTAMGAHPAARPLAEVAEVLQQLNAFDAKKIEEVDFETRMDALNRVNQRDFAPFTDETWLLAPVLAQYLQCMHDTEYSVRSTALAGLSLYMRLASTTEHTSPRGIVLLNVLESMIMPCVRASVKVPSEDTRRGFILLLGTIADYEQLHELPYIPGDLAFLRRADDVEADFFFNLTHIQVHRKRRAILKLGTLMAQMAEKKAAQETTAMKLAAVTAAQPGDEDEEDNEENDVEMTEAKEEWFSNSTVNHLLLPLVMHFIYEAQAKAQESLRQEAAQCIGSAAGLLGWSHYLALLRRLLKSIEGHGDMEQPIIATVCAVIDHHHFTNAAISTSKSWQDVRAEQQKAKQKKGEAETEEDAVTFRVQDQMETQVLPMLKKYLFKAVTAKGASKISATTSFDDSIVSSQHVTVRVPLALAIVKVLRRLRQSSFYLEFPKLLVSFTKLLKSKDDDVRSSARVTLVRIVEELGTPYLLPVVEELRHTLQDGYMVHVLAYTLHVIMEKVSLIAQPKRPQSLLTEGGQQQTEEAYASDLDVCLPSILEIIVEDLYRGVVENQDGSEHKSKMKEARSTTKSYDALELLTRSITFLPNASVHTIVAAIVTKFQEQPENAKSIQVMQEALRRIALGLVKNTGVERSHVFLYAYNVLQSCLESIRPSTEAEKSKYSTTTRGNALVSAWQVNEKSQRAAAQLAKRVSARDTVKVAMQSKMTGFNRHEIDDKQRETSRTHLDELLTFAVYLLFAFIRAKEKSGDEEGGEATAALVDPLVPQLMRCACESKNTRAVIHALKCLGVLLNTPPERLPLPSLDIAISPLVDRIFKILQKAGAATRNEMVQTCYRTLTVILRHRPEFRLTEAQLRVLVSFVRADLDERDHQNATYALLKSIIASRLVIPEIYDVVVRIGEILVQTDSQSARANCATIFITFLLEYPLGAKRLTQHLHFLMKNLTYEYESGRKAVLEALGALLKKLPLEIINDKAQFFLLPLVLRVANDESMVCRGLASEALKTLVKRMGNQALNESVALIAKWWATPKDKKLLSTAAQITTLVLECRPEFVDKHAAAVLDSARCELKSRVNELSVVDDSSALEWQLVVHLLTCIERLSECLIATYESWLLKTPAFLNEDLGACLEYPHPAVRLSALRVWSSYLRRRSPETLAFRSDKKIKKVTQELMAQSSTYLRASGTLFQWASRVCKLMEKPKLSEEAADEVLVVLSTLCAALEANPSIPQQVVSTAQPEEVAEVQEDGEEQQASEGSDEEQAETEEAKEIAEASQRQEQQEKEQSKTALGWILTRLSYSARGASEIVQMTTYKFFAAFMHEHKTDVVQRYVVQMVNPLYRAASALQKSEAQQVAAQVINGNKKYGKSTSAAAADEPPASAMLAQEVLERLEQKIGADAFLEAYTFVQKKLAIFRATRREKRKRELVNDPALAAKRKMQKNEQKRQSKQLKKRKYTVLKGTASAAARPSKVRRPGAE